MDLNTRIIISADTKGLHDTVTELEKVGKVDKNNADQFKKHHEERKKSHSEQIDFNTKLTHSFAELGQGIIAAFAVERVLQFGAECIKAFEEAQQAEKQLEFAVKNLAGGNDGSFKELQEQSEKLSGSLNNLFSPKQIEQSQAALLRMKLSTEQVIAIMPRLADIAAKTGKDLNSISEGFGKAISEGNTKALTEFGMKFKDTGTIVGNFNKVMESSAKYAGGATEAIDDWGNKAKESANKSEILQEAIGSKLAPAWETIKEGILEGVDAELNFFGTMYDNLTGKDRDWTKLGLAWVNAVLPGFTRGGETISESMKKFDKLSIDEKRKYVEQLKKEAQSEDGAERALAYGKLKDITRFYESKNKIIKEEEAKHEIDLKKLSDKELEIRLDSAKNQENDMGQLLEGFTTTGLAKEQARVQKEIDVRKKANDELKKLWEKYYNDLESIRKKDSEQSLKLELEAFEEGYAKKLKAQQNSYEKERLDLEERQKKLEEIQKKGSEKEIGIATKELKKIGELKIKLSTQNDVDKAKITEEHFKEESDRAMKAEIEKNEIVNRQGLIEAKKAFYNKKNTEDEYNKQVLGIQIEEMEKKLAIEKKYGIEDVKLQQDIEEKKLELQKKSSTKTKEFLAELQASTDLVMQAITNQMESNIRIIDTQITRQDKMIEYQKVLAEKGLANDLAFEERRADELDKKKMDEEQKLKRIKELEIFLNSVASFSQQDPKTALPKALGLLAATRAAEAVFAEEGGIMGMTTGNKSSLGLHQFAHRHKSGNDILIHGEKGEGVIPVNKMKEWGLTNPSRFDSFLRTPFNTIPIPSSKQYVVFNNNAEVVARLESVETAIKNIPTFQMDVNQLNEWVTKEVRNGITKITTHKKGMI